jgi:hypothetical protein
MVVFVLVVVVRRVVVVVMVMVVGLVVLVLGCGGRLFRMEGPVFIMNLRIFLPFTKVRLTAQAVLQSFKL